jgi:hypothetical protein
MQHTKMVFPATANLTKSGAKNVVLLPVPGHDFLHALTQQASTISFHNLRSCVELSPDIVQGVAVAASDLGK